MLFRSKFDGAMMAMKNGLYDANTYELYNDEGILLYPLLHPPKWHASSSMPEDHRKSKRAMAEYWLKGWREYDAVCEASAPSVKSSAIPYRRFHQSPH